MERSLKWRVLLIGGLLVLAAATVAPNVTDTSGLPKWMPAKKLTLGLDLQGGLHLQYSVEVDKAVNDKMERLARDLEAKLKAEDKGLDVKVRVSDGASVLAEFGSADARSKLTDDVLNDYMDLERSEPSPTSVRLSMADDIIGGLKDRAVDQSIETIRNRVDALGVTEPDIRKGKEGTDIVVQLPGLTEKDFQRAKKLIGRTAQLEFKMLDDENADKWVDDLRPQFPKDAAGTATITTGRDSTAGYLRADSKETLVTFLEGKLDVDHSVAYSQEGVSKAGRKTTESFWRTYYLKKAAPLTGEFINDARVAVDQRDRRPFVSLTFDAAGAGIFCELTTEHVKKRMGIQLDDVVNSAPVINEPICGGRAQITMGGNFRSQQELFDEARDLVTVLENGALPAPIHKQFETRVGATLGQDSIDAGKMSMMIGGVFVILFVLIYYQLAGLFANFALILNVLFIMAVLTAFEATLTLPGIAGIILTIGMAVDANVIIFERIREELRLGKTPRAAIDAGYAKAWTAIFDANLTTFIAGVVLYNYGTGPIKGFAVTLMVGIITSVFTAIVVTRTLFDWQTGRRRVERLSI